MSSPVMVFYSYAESEQDKELFSLLEKHLKIFEHTGRIMAWHKQEIHAGQEWQRESDTHFADAQIILLLISPDFMTSFDCYEVEMTRAMERHKLGTARVIPILLRPVYYKNAPFEQLLILPRSGRAITSWGPRLDEAFVGIARELSDIIQEFVSPSSTTLVIDHMPLSVSTQEQKELPMNQEAITLVLNALTYGTTAVTETTVSVTCKKSYEHLRKLLTTTLAGNTGAEEALLEFEQDPDGWRGPLKKALESVRIDKERGIVDAAQQLLVLEQQENNRGKFTIKVKENKGQINIGDHQQHTTYFNGRDNAPN